MLCQHNPHHLSIPFIHLVYTCKVFQAFYMKRGEAHPVLSASTHSPAWRPAAGAWRCMGSSIRQLGAGGPAARQGGLEHSGSSASSQAGQRCGGGSWLAGQQQQRLGGEAERRLQFNRARSSSSACDVSCGQVAAPACCSGTTAGPSHSSMRHLGECPAARHGTVQ